MEECADVADSVDDVLIKEENKMNNMDILKIPSIILMPTAVEIAKATTNIPIVTIPIATTTAVAAATAIMTTTTTTATNLTNSKTLKRCLSSPVIQTLTRPNSRASTTCMTTRSAAAAAAHSKSTTFSNECNTTAGVENILETPKKHTLFKGGNGGNGGHGGHGGDISKINRNNSICTNNLRIGIPRSNPSSREVSPAPVFNIFEPRARRYSASYTPANSTNGIVNGGSVPALRLTPRVSQLRKEECIDANSREMNHEREIHNAMQMSQSWEDLTFVTESWSCKSDEFNNPLQVVLPTSATACSSPSPTNTRAGLRLPYGLSPSPTRRTFATRRSMSPIAMRPSQLGPVKRKFELEDNNASNWNIYTQPPLKKIFSESRGSSPVYQSSSSVCASPDSGTYDGRITPKLLISKLCTSKTSTNNSSCSSPVSASPNGNNSIIPMLCDTTTHHGSFSRTSSISGNSEPMSIVSSLDEGISISESDNEKSQLRLTPAANTHPLQRMSTDMMDDASYIDDVKSETSSIGGFSNISIESSSCDSAVPKTATFFNKLLDETPPLQQNSTTATKTFYVNSKGGIGGAKKFIVNHDNLPNIITPTTTTPIITPTTPVTTKALTLVTPTSNDGNVDVIVENTI